MLSYIVRRLLLMIPTLIGTTLLVFLIMALSPGGLAASFIRSSVVCRSCGTRNVLLHSPKFRGSPPPDRPPTIDDIEQMF